MIKRFVAVVAIVLGATALTATASASSVGFYNMKTLDASVRSAIGKNLRAVNALQGYSLVLKNVTCVPADLNYFCKCVLRDPGINLTLSYLEQVKVYDDGYAWKSVGNPTLMSAP